MRQHILENGVLANPFAAMPSLHFGYALFIGSCSSRWRAGRWLRYLGFVYPVVVLVAIVATGNHFIIDAVGRRARRPGRLGLRRERAAERRSPQSRRDGARARRLTWRTSRPATPTAPAAGSSSSASFLARHGFTADMHDHHRPAAAGRPACRSSSPATSSGRSWSASSRRSATRWTAPWRAPAPDRPRPAPSSTRPLDRVSELMVAAALVVYFVREGPSGAPSVAVLVFMGAAQMVSYTAPAPRRSAWTARSASCRGRSASSASASGFLFSWWQPGGTSFLVWWLYLLAVLTVDHRGAPRAARAAQAAPRGAAAGARGASGGAGPRRSGRRAVARALGRGGRRY